MDRDPTAWPGTSSQNRPCHTSETSSHAVIWRTSLIPSCVWVHFFFYIEWLAGPLFTCLEHFAKAEGGTLLGAICSRILPVALNNGRTSMKTATETIPRHRTSAFSILSSSTKWISVQPQVAMISGNHRENLKDRFTPMKEAKKQVSSQHCKRISVS